VRGRAVTALALVLLAATAAAFAVTERLKLQRSPVTAPRFDRLLSPTCGCEKGIAKLRVTLRKADRVDASIVDSAGEPVRTLVTDAEQPKGVARLEWDGRDDRGEPVRDGRYRLRVHLERADRTITVPTPVRVDGTPPTVEFLGRRPEKLSPDGDGRGDRVLFTYRANETSYALVVVGGVDAVRGKYFPAGRGRVSWRGRLRGQVVEPDDYEVALVSVDRAGNRSQPTRSIRIPLRYVELVLRTPRVPKRGSLRFSVDADAKLVDWALLCCRDRRIVLASKAPPGVVTTRLPWIVPRGRLILRVLVDGNSDRAVVVVGRRRA
jgi:FlgD Ig-like domain